MYFNSFSSQNINKKKQRNGILRKMCKCAHFYLNILKKLWFIKRKLIFCNTIIYFLLPVLILGFQGSMVFLVLGGLVFIILPLRESSSCAHPLSSPPAPCRVFPTTSHSAGATPLPWQGDGQEACSATFRVFLTFILNGSGKMPHPP